ncbi:MAG: glycosyl hydrolase 115 family protein [Bacteroidales bacterium]|nr:glycosyl hydrolase 115 family protein [Bacteroidales bacterium]
MKKGFLLLLLTVVVGNPLVARDFTIRRGVDMTIQCDTTVMEPVVRSALQMLRDDLNEVFGIELVCVKESDGAIVVCQAPVRIDGQVRKEGFCLRVGRDGRLTVTGTDGHGIAYGLLELSRLVGVSPWTWWADCKPQPRDKFTLKKGFENRQAPAVEFRGIFINDEDWGLTPWANDHGMVGPRVNERIFQLLLRLRANTYWPAMHTCTVPFFLTPGNREMAERYGIYIGTSHCEPMACNVNGEWNVRGKGEYDYVNNSANVQRFFEERVRDIARQPVIYTLGMRGVHDGAMNGAKTLDEQRGVLDRVLNDQRALLRQCVADDVTTVPQVFIPYKEVLDVYNSGLRVPDDVTLMWCDDNYGYLTHLPTAEERRRSGGHGVYYHVSYWGRPHDYLWLGTFSPALLLQQMQTAYVNEVRKIWILNVGDIKPAEYQTELFMDLAWEANVQNSLLTQNNPKSQSSCYEKHLKAFLEREFGEEIARRVLPVMVEYYRLAFVCKPEFLGGTRTEETDRKYWNTVRDLPWTMKQIDQRLAAYERLEQAIEDMWTLVKPERQDAFFQLVKYPVQACAEMNKKMLLAQKARHGLVPWTESWQAYDSIAALTELYNRGIHNQGKWQGIMDFQPRRMPVFARIDSTSQALPLVSERDTLARFNACEGKGNDLHRWAGLGYEGGCVEIPEGKNLIFEWYTPQTSSSLSGKEVEIELHLLPAHPQQGNRVAIEVLLDGETSGPMDYATQGRSETWKQNILRSQALVRVQLPYADVQGKHHLEVRALTPGIILDQVFIF